MKNLLMVSFGFFIGTMIYDADANSTNLNVEELRLGKAIKAMPEAATQFGSRLNRFSKLIYTVNSYDGASRLIANEGNQLWRTAIDEYAKRKDFDDRPLYWARLKFNTIIKNTKLFAKLSKTEQQQLLWISELATRGNSDVEFDKNTRFKILLTGFDPFFLDRNIDQSNPSGVIATAFDNKVFYVGGQAVEVETLIVPVRFEDFDKGMIETMLTPRLQNKQVDMIVTVSMGRDDFDLERFPGLRRSAKAPDNLNVYTGASAENPLVPMYAGKMLKGPEFNQFSLPASAMKLAEGAFKINDNHKVTTKTKSFHPKTLNELEGEVSVQGSGGGYLSNEISYRSLLLRDKYQADLPVGHIHTPRYQGFKPEKIEKMVNQVEQMLIKALESLAETK
jgi:pyrrolidone-carboxylate peptidase